MSSNQTEKHPGSGQTLSVAVAGSGGSGAITTGTLMLEAAAKQGSYGILTRSVGPQIRGGEAAALVRLGDQPIECVGDQFDILLAMDWNNVDRFSAEIPLTSNSIIITDPEQGEIPAVIRDSGARILEVPIGDLARQVRHGRPNMISLGILASITGLEGASLRAVLEKQLGEKGEQVLESSVETVEFGRRATQDLASLPLPRAGNGNGQGRWIITGNNATGYGALKGGIRFVAAYPITPATEVLEWMAGGLPRVGGRLVQAEDELASINMVIGSSYGGVPSLTATSGPGLSLMMESLGLAVGAEIPLVVVDVMRVGPSTGIATKAEQSDLNIAVYGFHGDAPHVVVAPNSIADCLFTSQWSAYLAESLQVPVIMLSDQYLGQTRSVINAPREVKHTGVRLVADAPGPAYERYALTESGISPMSIPGTPGGQYIADGLEHTASGIPSTRAEDHALQMDKRQHKIAGFDYGEHWADVEGDGSLAVITWGSTTGALREALHRLAAAGGAPIRLIAMRLLTPAQPERFAAALEGVDKVLVVEQSHGAQLYHLLHAQYRLPARTESYRRAGPLPIRPGEILDKLTEWSKT